MPWWNWLSLVHYHPIKLIRVINLWLIWSLLLILFLKNKIANLNKFFKSHMFGYFIFPVMLEPFKADHQYFRWINNIELLDGRQSWAFLTVVIILFIRESLGMKQWQQHFVIAGFCVLFFVVWIIQWFIVIDPFDRSFAIPFEGFLVCFDTFYWDWKVISEIHCPALFTTTQAHNVTSQVTPKHLLCWA